MTTAFLLYLWICTHLPCYSLDRRCSSLSLWPDLPCLGVIEDRLRLSLRSKVPRIVRELIMMQSGYTHVRGWCMGMTPAAVIGARTFHATTTHQVPRHPVRVENKNVTIQHKRKLSYTYLGRKRRDGCWSLLSLRVIEVCILYSKLII